MQEIHDIIIIGGGPAGYTAALYAARGGLDTLVLERMSIGGQMTETGSIDNYPGFEDGIDGVELGMKMQASAERFGAKSELADVTRVELSGKIKRIFTDFGEYAARAVIIATGATPRPLGIDGEAELVGRGIHYCAHCDGRFYSDRTLVVVGGGNSAAEDALYLSRLAKRVYLVHRRNSLRADRIYRDAIARTGNIELLLNRRVSEIISSQGRVTGARLASTVGEGDIEIGVAALFVSIGRDPRSSLFCDQLALDAGGYIVADESTRSSIPGVFAVGDVRTKELRQVVTAVADGAVAAHYAEKYLAEE